MSNLDESVKIGEIVTVFARLDKTRENNIRIAFIHHGRNLALRWCDVLLNVPIG